MNILAIETTGPFCSVALIDDNDELEELMGDEKMNHLKTVTPMIEALLERNNLTLADLDVIAVSRGPGSFTGIRIGVSTARALSQATGVPVMAIPTLAAFGCGEGEEGQTVCAVLDARRQQVYAGAYRDFEELVPAGAYMLEEFLELLEGEDDLLFVGDGVDKYGEQIAAWAEEKGKSAEGQSIYQSAGNVAEYAADTYAEDLLLSCEQVEPEYMRRPEAERKRLAREAAAEQDEK